MGPVAKFEKSRKIFGKISILNLSNALFMRVCGRLERFFPLFMRVGEDLERIFGQICPGIFPNLRKDSNLSKFFESFQTLYLCGFEGIEIFPKIFPHACERARARIYMEFYPPLKGGDINSNVNSLERFKSFQNSPAKNCDASPLSPAGAARCNFSAGRRRAEICA